MVRGIEVLNKVVSIGLIENVKFKQILEVVASCAVICENIPVKVVVLSWGQCCPSWMAGNV